MNRIIDGFKGRLAQILEAPRGETQQPTPPVSQGLTPEHVIWAYRLLLDREPENSHVIAQKLAAWTSVKELRNELMASSEFQQKNSDLGYTTNSNIVIKEIGDGLRLFVDLADYAIGWSIIQGCYEPDEIDLVRRLVKPGQTVLDIGANIGLFTIIMAFLVSETGQVYAFEPLKRNAGLLKRSVAESNFTDRVIVEQAAIGDQSGYIELVSPDTTLNWGGAYVRTPGADIPAGHSAEKVPFIMLDTYPLKRPVGLIKIDVEGAEPLALRGARSILEADRPVILSEINPIQLMKVAGCTPSDFVSLLKEFGYSCYRFSDGMIAEKIAEYTGSEIISVIFAPQETSVDSFK